MWNLKNKQMNITKKKQTHRYKLVVNIGEKGEGARWGRGLRVTNYYVKKLQRYIIQHREYNQYFTITLNGV